MRSDFYLKEMAYIKGYSESEFIISARVENIYLKSYE